MKRHRRGLAGERAKQELTNLLGMDEEVDPDIGRVVGFQTGDLMYIATIISIDDGADQFTVRTEDGQELTGPLGAVFLDPEKRMEELNERYEPLGGGTFREKPREATSNWVPVADPTLRDIGLTGGKIVGFVLTIGIFITLISFGDILTQIDSGNWRKFKATWWRLTKVKTAQRIPMGPRAVHRTRRSPWRTRTRVKITQRKTTVRCPMIGTTRQSTGWTRRLSQCMSIRTSLLKQFTSKDGTASSRVRLFSLSSQGSFLAAICS